MVNKKDDMPKFKKVALMIEDKIKKGLYVTTQKLPSEYDLAREFDVSRLTVRKAIDDLIEQNILVKRKGKGSYVMGGDKIQSGSSGLESFTESAKRMGKTVKTEVISFKLLEEVPLLVETSLELDELSSQQIFELVRRRSLDGEPMTIEKIYIDKSYLADCTVQDLEGSLFDIIENKTEIGYSHQEIEAVLVDEEISGLFDIPVGEPLLKAYSNTYSLDSTVVLYDISYYRADKYTFKNILTRKH